MQFNKRNTTEIIINGRFLTQQVSGVQSFARSVCRELIEEVEFKIVVPEKGKLINTEFQDKIIRFGKWQGHLWEQFDLPAFMKQNPGSTLLNLCNTGPWKITNQVLTVHDLAFRKNPGWFNPFFSGFYNFLIPRIANKSKAILTVSQTIKQELVSQLGIASDKIFVVGNKVSETFLIASPLCPNGITNGKDPFFLMVGSNDPRKNFIIAKELFSKGFHGVKLVIAGGDNSNFRKVPENSISSDSIIRTGYINDSELKWLYMNCIGFINPSFYEGFGIPNLEAMSQGCRIFCSDIPVFREICGKAADYFDPNSIESLKSTLENYLNNKLEGSTQISEGKGIFEKLQFQNRTAIILKALTK